MRQPESLVSLIASHRPNRARRIAIQRVRVVGGAAVGIQKPAVGALLASDSLDAHFALGRGAGGEIKHQGSLGMRDAKSERISAQPRRGAADRRDALRGRRAC